MSATKWLLVPVVLGLLTFQKSFANDLIEEDYNEDRITQKLQAAVDQVSHKQPQGLWTLYEMANDDQKYGVAYSESAKQILDETLTHETEYWVQSMSQIKGFSWNGITNDSAIEGSFDEFRRKFVSKLEKMKVTAAEARVIQKLTKCVFYEDCK
jgi:hypothetical protein